MVRLRRGKVCTVPPFLPFPHTAKTSCGEARSAAIPSKHKKDGSSPSFLHALVSHAPQGRGGSVSRRDHNQLAGNRTQLSGGTISAEAATSNASRSSGGSAREGLLSEKPPPSHTHVYLLRTRGSRRRRTFRCSACSHEPCRSGGRSGALPPKEHPQNPDE